MTTAIDTSVLVAAVLDWHEHHAAARRAVSAALASGVLVPTRVLVESYAVLTRLPSPHRLAPDVALAVLAGTLRSSARIVVLPAAAHWDLLTTWAAEGVAGGVSYDAEIAANAANAGATRLVTFNLRHFVRVAPAGLEVVAPER